LTSNLRQWQLAGALIRLAFLGAALLGTLPSALALGDTAHGALLPPGAHEVGPDRYQAAAPFAETMKFYQKTYSAEHYPRRSIADLPGVRAVHLSNPSRSGWDGLNIYELNGVTRIYVLVHEAPAKGKSVK
jgi:hypothetical protein